MGAVVRSHELRLRNANLAGETTTVGARLGSARLVECLRAARDAIGWQEAKANRRDGIGVAHGGDRPARRREIARRRQPDGALAAQRNDRLHRSLAEAALAHHQRAGIEMAQWLKARPEVLKVLHPALPDHPGHAIWKRDFTGASGLFGVVLKPASEKAVAAMIDGMKHFSIGYSWGGYESLILPAHYHRSFPVALEGPLIRLHVGLEDVDDLKADLMEGFERLRQAA